MEYLPLYRIKGGTLKCEGEKCTHLIDANVAHLYLFYILDGENEVGIIFEYHATSTESFSGGFTSNPCYVGPAINAGTSITTQSLDIKMMTIDPVQVVKDFHPNLIIRAETSFKRSLLNWYRKRQGLYTRGSELYGHDYYRNVEIYLGNIWTRQENYGILCVQCMRLGHENHYKNAVLQFNGWAKLD